MDKSGASSKKNDGDLLNVEDDTKARIEARRQRNTARRLMIKNGEDPRGITADKAADSLLPMIELRETKISSAISQKQVMTSNKRLAQTKTTALDFTTNVVVASENRELKRRHGMKKTLDHLRKARTEELKTAENLNAEIEKNWDIPKDQTNVDGKPRAAHGGPHNVLDVLKAQRDRCDNLMGLRNKLIAEYQQEINFKDDEFVEEIKKQAAEVLLITQRMTAQQKDLKRVCAEEIRQIEEAHMRERSEILGEFLGEWEKLMELRRQKEVNHLETYAARAEEHVNEMDELRIKDSEEFNWNKAKLETDVHVLTQQLQQMKATYQLNSEKLEYNFQVLKKRDEENNLAITSQKRKITRLNDFVNSLRIKLAKQEKSYQKDYKQISEEYQRILAQFRDLRNKFNKFRAKDDHIYEELWSMNDEEVSELTEKLATADKIIWEQLLEMKWECPPELLRAVQRRQKSTKQSQQSFTALTKEEIGKLLDSKLTKRILMLLVQEASDLFVDERLRQLLGTLSSDEQVLMKIDSLFRSIGVKSMEDVEKMERYFIVGKSNDGEVELLAAERVIGALNRFVVDQGKTAGALEESSFEKAQNNSENPLKYWEEQLEISEGSYFQTWELLYSAMMDYQKTLTDRINLKDDTDKIAQENEELKSLLQEYATSQTNLELAVPPIKQYAVKKIRAPPENPVNS